MSIIKLIRRKIIAHIFRENWLLETQLRFDFHKSPLKYTLLAAYLAPVSSYLRIRQPSRQYEVMTSREYYEELHELLHLAKINGTELVRIGRDNDGGYIMPDDFGHDDKIAYSFGISTDVSWDKAMASRGYDVFMYDHTIDSLPEENPRFHWSKLGISDGTGNDDRLKPLDELIKANHHEDKHNMILKMDVEKAEWGFFEMVSPDTLSRFTTILIELHGINEPALQGRVAAALRKINKTHKAVHIHGQNVGYYISLGSHTFCNQIEVSYVRRDKYSLDENYDVNLPLAIDMPAISRMPEVCLGRWNRDIHPDDKFVLTSVTM